MTPGLITFISALGIKLLIVVGLIIYTIFAAVIVRQEQLMSHVLEESSEPILRLFSYIHLIATLATLILSIVIL